MIIVLNGMIFPSTWKLTYIGAAATALLSSLSRHNKVNLSGP